MQATTKEWVIKTLEQLPPKETEQLIDYLDFLVWRTKQEKTEQKETGKNLIAQRIIKAMEQPPEVTHEDVEALLQEIEDGRMPVKFDSPFEPNGQE